LRQQPRMCTASPTTEISQWRFAHPFSDTSEPFKKGSKKTSGRMQKAPIDEFDHDSKLPNCVESQKSCYSRYQISCSYQVGCALQDCSVPFEVRRQSLCRERSFKSSEIDGSWKKGCLQWSFSSPQSACKLKGSIRLLSHVV